jgi:hypothetical protein
MENKIVIEGFAMDDGRIKRIDKMSTSPISNATFKFDGYRLDELVVSVILKTENDFDELIRLLQIHKNCFSRPTKTKV